MKVAIIPARGGSKRIARKNIRAFAGKPIIAHSIEAALASACFDRIVVSTDDDEIADIARSSGAEVPFKRPPELSDDHTGTSAVIRHAIEQLDGGSGAVAFACCIYATAPFVRAEDIRQGLLMLQSRACEFVFSVTDFAYPIERALHLGPQGEVSMLRPQAYQTRSQDLEPAFHDAGQFYWGRAQAWIDERPVFGDGALGLRLPRHRVQDIDTPEDWIRAEWMFRAMRAAEGG